MGEFGWSASSVIWNLTNHQAELSFATLRWDKLSQSGPTDEQDFVRLNCFVISDLCDSVDGWIRSGASDTLSPWSPRCQAPPTAEGSLMMAAPDLCPINISISAAQNKPPLFTTCFRAKTPNARCQWRGNSLNFELWQILCISSHFPVKYPNRF